MNREALMVIALANKAGKLISGEDAVLESIRNRTACLTVISEDASENTKKRFQDKCRFYGVDCMEGASKRETAAMLGKEERSAIAFSDEGLKQLFLKKLK